MMGALLAMTPLSSWPPMPCPTIPPSYLSSAVITTSYLSSLRIPIPIPIPIRSFFGLTTTTTTTITAQPQLVFACQPHHAYTTEIVSLSPLLIYIHSFLSPSEIAFLLSPPSTNNSSSSTTSTTTSTTTSSNKTPIFFAPSHVTKNGRKQPTPDRTSTSAALPRSDPAVSCVLARARAFLGTMLLDGVGVNVNAPREEEDGMGEKDHQGDDDDVGPPQLVRYEVGQRFNVHRDWYERLQPERSRGWNRVASFFAVLECDECEGGETWFPKVEVPSAAMDGAEEEGKGGERGHRVWRRHEDGGIAFRPVAGNALFWVNLHENGTGDWRTVHAGLPLEKGLKTAMNIWPRKFYS
ncbi:hypothetical protein F4778DRAFT_798133 [Xylariomycetidae sp. FL2044]|nr:hypothetical protein F4778DRAFT_798133 [Xylariomycetidae sp. FL2044]